jgi:hypothetical protein
MDHREESGQGSEPERVSLYVQVEYCQRWHLALTTRPELAPERPPQPLGFFRALPAAMYASGSSLTPGITYASGCSPYAILNHFTWR